MSKAYDNRPELDYFLAVAHTERAEAMARTAYLLVDAIERAVRAALGGIARGSRALAGTVAAQRRRRAAFRALQALDDRMLRDVGLTRADLWAAAHGQQSLTPDEDRRPAAPASSDIALGDAEIRGCNDNGSRRRAA